jgi:hypothetical protein
VLCGEAERFALRSSTCLFRSSLSWEMREGRIGLEKLELFDFVAGLLPARGIVSASSCVEGEETTTVGIVSRREGEP